MKCKDCAFKKDQFDVNGCTFYACKLQGVEAEPDCKYYRKAEATNGQRTIVHEDRKE